MSTRATSITSLAYRLPVVYEASSLRFLYKLDEWFALLSGDMHIEQRRTIFRTILVEELRSIDTVKRFAKFLSSFDQLYQRFQDNYQLYVAEFSFEKVLAEITEKKLDYVLKLNKTFSDMQNQLLAIPVAVILAGSQMEAAGMITIKNSIVFVGVLIFSLLMALLVRNQLDNVTAIGREIQDQHTSLKKNQAAIADMFSPAYCELTKRERHQRRLIRIIDGLVALALFGTACLFFWYSGILKTFEQISGI